MDPPLNLYQVETVNSYNRCENILTVLQYRRSPKCNLVSRAAILLVAVVEAITFEFALQVISHHGVFYFVCFSSLSGVNQALVKRSAALGTRLAKILHFSNE